MYDRFLGHCKTVFWVSAGPLQGPPLTVFDWPLQGQSLTVPWVPVWPFLSLRWTVAGSIIDRLLGFLIEHAYRVCCWISHVCLDLGVHGSVKSSFALRSFTFAPSHNGTLHSAGYIVMSKDSGSVYLDWSLILVTSFVVFLTGFGFPWTAFVVSRTGFVVPWTGFSGSLYGLIAWLMSMAREIQVAGIEQLEVRIFFGISSPGDLSFVHCLYQILPRETGRCPEKGYTGGPIEMRRINLGSLSDSSLTSNLAGKWEVVRLGDYAACLCSWVLLILVYWMSFWWTGLLDLSWPVFLVWFDRFSGS